MKTSRLFAPVLGIILACATVAPCADTARPATLLFTTENDLYANAFKYKSQDRHYTQGLKIMYLGADRDFTRACSNLIWCAPKLGLEKESCNIGFALGQNMYTPLNKAAFGPIPGDQPYAGWLYGGFIFQRHGLTRGGIPVLDNYELDLGVVGPASLGNVIQRQWHEWIGSDRPNGWEHQLKNEPGLELKYARYWRLTPNENVGRYFDFVPHLGVDLGNIRVDANVGAFLRFGYNLPQDFGVTTIEGAAPATALVQKEKGHWFSCHIFVGGEGRAIARDIFLDGNTFADSLSVHKNPLVGDFIWGGGFVLFQHFEATFTGVIRSDRFNRQPGGQDAFGSITVKAVFWL